MATSKIICAVLSKRTKVLCALYMLLVMCTSTFRATLFALLLVPFGAFAQKKAPWRTIFNGKNLDGWSVVGSKGKVVVIDSAMVCSMTANTPEHTFARTNRRYRDFILELECRRIGPFNSGILFRAVNAPDTASVCLYGYQVKLDPNEKRRWTGGIFDDFGKSWKWIYDLSKDERAQNAHQPNGAWNHYRIEMIGDVIKVWVNGVPTAHVRTQKYQKAGYFAFKMHSLGNKPEQEAWNGQFRHIRVIRKWAARYSRVMELPLVER